MSAFQTVVDRLDLKGSLTRGSERNDLLLPRAEDRVGGEVGNRFLEALRRDLDRGRYDPTRAYIVRVPKSTSATRPAALLSLNDRVVYEALVASLRPRIESYLLGPAFVFWPRGVTSEKAWLRFEHSPLAGACEYVVIADISGFYESIDHERLAEHLIRATGKRQEVEALVELLSRVMGGARGLPQGLEPSDPIATAYLAEVDFAMVRDGFAYSRHGDDIRIATTTYEQARAAVFAIETRARQVGLLLNSHKTKILRVDTYSRELRSIEQTIAETRAKVLSRKIAELEENEERLAAAIDLADKEELGWEFFYHGNISLEEVIKELSPSLEPNDLEVAENLFIDTWENRPGTKAELSSDAFHQRLVASLVRLAAGRSPVALTATGDILLSYPDKSEIVCSYLLALAGSEPALVASEAAKVLTPGRFRTEWETAWALRVLTSVAGHIPAYVQAELDSIVQYPFDAWLAATEAAKLMGAQRLLQREVFLRLWNSCPPVFRADLVVAASYMAEHASWAETFLSAAKDDRINEVVLNSLQRQKDRPASSSK